MEEDNWLSSVEVMNKMLPEYRLTMVGTFRKDAKGIPSEFTAKKREIYSSLFGFKEDMTIVSYIPKKSIYLAYGVTVRYIL